MFALIAKLITKNTSGKTMNPDNMSNETWDKYAELEEDECCLFGDCEKCSEEEE